MVEQTLNFITLRQPERINQKVKRLRYIRDVRENALAPIREQLMNTDVYGQKLVIAQTFKNTPLFFTVSYYYTLKYETIVETLRETTVGPISRRDGTVENGVEIATIISTLEERLPIFQTSNFFTAPSLPPGVLGGLFLQYSSIWESLYCITVLAGILRQETNYLIDAIRAMHVLTVLRGENLKTPPTVYWPFYDFDAYEAMIDEDIIKYKQLV